MGKEINLDPDELKKIANLSETLTHKGRLEILKCMSESNEEEFTKEGIFWLLDTKKKKESKIVSESSKKLCDVLGEAIDKLDAHLETLVQRECLELDKEHYSINYETLKVIETIIKALNLSKK